MKRPSEDSGATPAKKAKSGSTSLADKVSSTTHVVEPGTLPPLKPVSEIASYYTTFYYNMPAVEEMATHEIILHYYLDHDLLNKIGLSERIKNYIRTIGWEEWLISNDNTPTYRELYLEFYSSLVIDEIAFKSRNLTAKTAITYRLFGQDFPHSYNSFNQVLGSSTKGLTDYPHHWD